MSRQKGSRPRPVPEQRRYHEQFERRRPARAISGAASEPSPAPSRRRLWAAVLLATLVLVVSFTAIVTAIVEADEGDTSGARFAVAVAVALVPVAFTILARVSRTSQPFRRVLLASPLAMAGYVALGSLIREPTSSLVIAFGVAGAYVLRIDPPHRIATRIMVVSLTGILVLLLYVMAQTAAIIAAPFLPFAVLLLADRIAALRPTV